MINAVLFVGAFLAVGLLVVQLVARDPRNSN